MVGGILFLIHKSFNLSDKQKALLWSTGMALIFIPAFIYSSNTQFPGFYAIPPTLGAAFIIASQTHELSSKLVFSNPLIVNTGNIS
jgi:peptidoglycan/LPS O-acetylase OafA/YrhL